MSEKLYVYIDGEKIEAKGELLAELIARQEQAQDELQAKAAKKQKELDDRKAVLEKLGLTADEAKVLLG